ncbi:MAG: hypothetical protein K6T78_11585 [Alicyclobacillus sp.]|nr:hypothetical protein [Alicyclobacillus sp.]
MTALAGTALAVLASSAFTTPAAAYAATGSGPTVQSVADSIVNVATLAKTVGGSLVTDVQSLTSTDWDQIVFGASGSALSTSQQQAANTLVPVIQSMTNLSITDEADAESAVNEAVSDLQSLGGDAVTESDALTYLSDLETSVVAAMIGLKDGGGTVTADAVKQQLSSSFHSVTSGFPAIAAIFAANGGGAGAISGGAGGGGGDGSGSNSPSGGNAVSTLPPAAAKLVQQALGAISNLMAEVTANPGAQLQAKSGSTALQVTAEPENGTGGSGGLSSAPPTLQLTMADNLSPIQAILPGGFKPLTAFTLAVDTAGVAGTESTPAPVRVQVHVENAQIRTGSVVYQLTVNGLQHVNAQLSPGSADVTLSVAGPNTTLVVLNPQAAPKMKAYQRDIQLNGHVQNVVPAVVQGGTTYMPIWYVGSLLKSLGVTPYWNGQTWNLTFSPSNVGPAALPRASAVKGEMGILMNGVRVENVKGVQAKDPSTGKLTTYMPIWYLTPILNALGLHSQWDGQSWFVAQDNPAVPQ